MPFPADVDYDTDDTDELLASKGCVGIPIVRESHDRPQQQAQQEKGDVVEENCLVTDDWLFSIASTQQGTIALAHDCHEVSAKAVSSASSSAHAPSWVLCTSYDQVLAWAHAST